MWCGSRRVASTPLHLHIICGVARRREGSDTGRAQCLHGHSPALLVLTVNFPTLNLGVTLLKGHLCPLASPSGISDNEVWRHCWDDWSHQALVWQQCPLAWPFPVSMAALLLMEQGETWSLVRDLYFVS
jgi:hypothetical protein